MYVAGWLLGAPGPTESIGARGLSRRRQITDG